MPQSALKSPSERQNPPALREIGLAHYRNEKWSDAVSAFDRALESCLPDSEADLLLWRGMALVQSGALADGTADLERAASAGHLEARYQVALQYAGQARTQRRLRRRAISHLEAIISAHDTGLNASPNASEDARDTLAAGLDRVCFALGGLYIDTDGNEEDRNRGIAVYRRGLSINPLSPAGHNNLGLLLTKAQQRLAALGEFKVAIQLDPEFRAAHTNLAHLLYKHVQRADLADEFAHIVEEFGDSAPTVISQLSLELVDLGRQQVYRSLYTKGHQLKNLMGLVGSRLKGVARTLATEHSEVTAELGALEVEHERLYDEWVGYLATMTPDKLYIGLVDPSHTVRSVVDAVRTQAGTAQLTLRVQEGVPRIEADARLLREAVTNLALNALEAGVDTEGKISVGVGFDERTGVVFIEVEDDGPGIAQEIIEHIFDPGFTTKDSGNGYGLSIARRIAQAHYGELRVKSKAGVGTVFRLDLPVNFDAGSRPDSLD